MTHLEKLKEAKTAQDYYAQLFEFETELKKRKFRVDIFEWLNSEDNPIGTLRDALEQLSGLGKALKATNDLSDMLNKLFGDDENEFHFEWERDED